MVSSWVMYYVDESPHKDRHTRMCVCERETLSTELPWAA